MLYCREVMKNYKTLLSLALFPLLAAAATERMNIKPGLWEITSQSSGAPAMSPERQAQMDAAMARMSPEMRARMEAARKQQAAPQVTKSCITKEDVDRPFDFNNDKSQQNCTYTALKGTSTMQEVRVECSIGERKSTGIFHVEAPTPTAWNGTMDVTVSGKGSNDIKVKNTMSGKWLGADCGDVKPREHKK